MPKRNRRDSERLLSRQERREAALRKTFGTQPSSEPVVFESPDFISRSRGSTRKDKPKPKDEFELIPRILRDDELPAVTSPSLRMLINLTAAGEPTPSELREALLPHSGEEVARAISEGIRRWHTPSKERE